MSHIGAYVCPKTGEPLTATDGGLASRSGLFFPFLATESLTARIPNFVRHTHLKEHGRFSAGVYDQAESVEIYRNFLNWLFKTFEQDEAAFRDDMISRLHIREGARVLVTGCGLGDDLQPILNRFGGSCEIYAMDLSVQMVLWTAKTIIDAYPGHADAMHFSICDATALPFSDGFFDAAFHFGGINLFDDVKAAIHEMARVVKDGGRVCFGDESCAPWLRETDYGRMVIVNNRLWNAHPPMQDLPFSAVEPRLSWVLGNCFYLVDFTVRSDGPVINPDVPHPGVRGGSMRTRYLGQLEGVSEESKNFVLADARSKGISVYQWLEEMIREKSASPPLKKI